MDIYTAATDLMVEAYLPRVKVNPLADTPLY